MFNQTLHSVVDMETYKSVMVKFSTDYETHTFKFDDEAKAVHMAIYARRFLLNQDKFPYPFDGELKTITDLLWYSWRHTNEGQIKHRSVFKFLSTLDGLNRCAIYSTVSHHTKITLRNNLLSPGNLSWRVTLHISKKSKRNIRTTRSEMLLTSMTKLAKELS